MSANSSETETQTIHKQFSGQSLRYPSTPCVLTARPTRNFHSQLSKETKTSPSRTAYSAFIVLSGGVDQLKRDWQQQRLCPCPEAELEISDQWAAPLVRTLLSAHNRACSHND